MLNQYALGINVDPARRNHNACSRFNLSVYFSLQFTAYLFRLKTTTYCLDSECNGIRCGILRGKFIGWTLTLNSRDPYELAS